MELAGGFTGEVDDAIALAGLEGMERGLQHDAGFTEAGRSLEGDDGSDGECGVEDCAGVFLSGAKRGKGGLKDQRPAAGLSALVELEKLKHALQTEVEESFVFAAEDEGLREATACFDEDKFTAQGGLRRGDAAE